MSSIRKRDQHVDRMARRHRALRQRMPQIDRFLLRVALTQQFRFEQVDDTAENSRPRASTVSGDVVAVLTKL